MLSDHIWILQIGEGYLQYIPLRKILIRKLKSDWNELLQFILIYIKIEVMILNNNSNLL